MNNKLFLTTGPFLVTFEDLKPDNQAECWACWPEGPSHPAELSERTIEHSTCLSSHIVLVHKHAHTRKQERVLTD